MGEARRAEDGGRVVTAHYSIELGSRGATLSGLDLPAARVVAWIGDELTLRFPGYRCWVALYTPRKYVRAETRRFRLVHRWMFSPSAETMVLVPRFEEIVA